MVQPRLSHLFRLLLNLNCYLFIVPCFYNADCVVYCLFIECIGLVLEFCQLVFESSNGGASVCRDSKEVFAVNNWVSFAF